MNYKLLLAGMIVAGVSVPATFGAKLGDAATELSIKEWVKGNAVNVKDGKNVYVVEFWATWCGPCRVSIPHLTEVQKKFKDKGVVVIGISDETAEKVKPFVKEQGEKMDYVVAVDDDRKTSKAYMEAFGQGGIPHAFIVSKEGKIIWHDHPMGGLDTALEQILAGKYDVKSAIKKDEARAELAEYSTLARNGDAKAKELGQKLLKDREKDASGLVDLAYAIATDGRVKERDFALAEEALKASEKITGKATALSTATLGIVRFESGKMDDGIELAKKAATLADDAKEKERFERYVTIMEGMKKRKLAEKK